MTKPKPYLRCPRCYVVIKPDDDVCIASGGYLFHLNCEPEDEHVLKKIVALANGWRPDKRREVYLGSK